jgi:hypothetical protein
MQTFKTLEPGATVQAKDARGHADTVVVASVQDNLDGDSLSF